jgi:excisionase family DNA binding protein
MTSRSDPELLTVEEFAQRFRVGRSTVFFWIAGRKMIQGIHYYKIGKTIRIPWCVELLVSLSADREEPESAPKKHGRNQESINLDY